MPINLFEEQFCQKEKIYFNKRLFSTKIATICITEPTSIWITIKKIVLRKTFA